MSSLNSDAVNSKFVEKLFKFRIIRPVFQFERDKCPPTIVCVMKSPVTRTTFDQSPPGFERGSVPENMITASATDASFLQISFFRAHCIWGWLSLYCFPSQNYTFKITKSIAYNICPQNFYLNNFFITY